jgi:hypothetical protein
VDHDDSGTASGASSRPLGRGLEDISHLFLSGLASPAARGPAHSSEAAPSPAATRPAVALLRPAPLTRDRLAAVLAGDGVLEERLRTIDVRIPCRPCGEIDLLALDRAETLTIIDFETTVNDGLLVRGLGHFDWLVSNMPNLQRMYPARGADFSRPPRLVLLAPQFSPLLRRAMRQIVRPRISWGRYHTVETPGGPEIAIEPVAGE